MELRHTAGWISRRLVVVCAAAPAAAAACAAASEVLAVVAVLVTLAFFAEGVAVAEPASRSTTARALGERAFRLAPAVGFLGQ